MALRYCFEQSYVARTLVRSKPHDLAVVDTEGYESYVRQAVSRGVYAYGYLNVGALEKERPYYENFHHIRLAPYDGWKGEYWIDPTAREWQEHILSLAKQIKACGAIGLYLDNTDIYYMIAEREIHKQYNRNIPTAQAVYTALSNMILKINALGLIVMPNGGDTKSSSGNGVGTLSAHANFGSIVAESGTLKCADYNGVNYYPIPIPAGTTKLKITYTNVSSTRVAHINWFNSQVQSVDGYAQLVGRTDSGLTGASVVEVSIPTFSGYTFDSCNICILSTGFIASDFDKVSIEYLNS